MMNPKLTISSAHPPTPESACAGGATGIANVPKNPINQHTPHKAHRNPLSLRERVRACPVLDTGVRGDSERLCHSERSAAE